MEDVTWLRGPRALRAYAHPVRLALVGLLREHGPLTATRAGQLLGESSGTCSFHLRQLAKYGLVEETGDGTGRNKPWRATTRATGWDTVNATPQERAAAGLLAATLAERYFEQLTEWLERYQDEPQEWQQGALFGDLSLYVTSGELAEIGRKVQALIAEYDDRDLDPALRPAGARHVTYLNLAYPRPAKERADGE